MNEEDTVRESRHPGQTGSKTRNRIDYTWLSRLTAKPFSIINNKHNSLSKRTRDPSDSAPPVSNLVRKACDRPTEESREAPRSLVRSFENDIIVFDKSTDDERHTRAFPRRYHVK